VNVTDIAGITGAYLAYLVNEAAIFATWRSADQITMNDFTNAVERIVAGAEWRGRLLKHENHAHVAYHEMGTC
jgi:cell division protease FtsH